jgi:hypothetical protein
VDDLGMHPIAIVDGEWKPEGCDGDADLATGRDVRDGAVTEAVGIESTVLKIEDGGRRVRTPCVTHDSAVASP